MRRYLTIKRINTIAWKLLQTVGINKAPVDLDAVAKHLNIEIKKEHLGDDISGLLVNRDGKVICGVNEKHPPNRRRFTIAHEFGHFVLGHERQGLFIDKHKHESYVIFRNEKSSEGTNQQEIEANAFAAALLMPGPFVKAEIKKCINDDNTFVLDDSNIKKLAKKFGVSEIAMTYRIGNLDLFDTM